MIFMSHNSHKPRDGVFPAVNIFLVAGEIAQQLRTLAGLPVDPGLIPSIYMVAHKAITPAAEYLTPSHRHTCKQNTDADKIKINQSLKIILKRNEHRYQIML